MKLRSLLAVLATATLFPVLGDAQSGTEALPLPPPADQASASAAGAGAVQQSAVPPAQGSSAAQRAGTTRSTGDEMAPPPEAPPTPPAAAPAPVAPAVPPGSPFQPALAPPSSQPHALVLQGPPHRAGQGQKLYHALLARFDVNHQGYLTPDEQTQAMAFLQTKRPRIYAMVMRRFPSPAAFFQYLSRLPPAQ